MKREAGRGRESGGGGSPEGGGQHRKGVVEERRGREGRERTEEGQRGQGRWMGGEREEDAGRATCRRKLRSKVWGQNTGVGRKERLLSVEE